LLEDCSEVVLGALIVWNKNLRLFPIGEEKSGESRDDVPYDAKGRNRTPKVSRDISGRLHPWGNNTLLLDSIPHLPCEHRAPVPFVTLPIVLANAEIAPKVVELPLASREFHVVRTGLIARRSQKVTRKFPSLVGFSCQWHGRSLHSYCVPVQMLYTLPVCLNRSNLKHPPKDNLLF
jgi:hypothetical protein